MLAGQVEAEAVLLDLVFAPFEPLTSGSGGGVLLGKKEKLVNVICPVMVSSMPRVVSRLSSSSLRQEKKEGSFEAGIRRESACKRVSVWCYR
jgi:hypothetical protein